MPSTDKPAPTTHDLKTLVRKQLKRLSADAVAKGEVSDEDIYKLSQLTELEAILPEASDEPARRWPVILLVLGVFLVPGVMFSLKVPSVELELNLQVTGLSWKQLESGEVMGHVGLERLTARSFSTIQLPQTRHAPSVELTEPPGIFSIQKGSTSKVVLAPAHADSGTHVWISKTPGEPTAELSMLGANTYVNANLSGLVSVSSGLKPADERDFGRPRSVKISAIEPNKLNLALHFQENSDFSFPTNIMISSLSLQQVETSVVEGLRTPREVSTILEGEIFNASMNGRRYELRKGEWLKLDGIEGEIRSMRMTTAGILLNYHGEVTNITVGSIRNQRSLMPNWLEWFGERHNVKMFWGAFLWILSTLFGVIRWWRRSH